MKIEVRAYCGKPLEQKIIGHLYQDENTLEYFFLFVSDLIKNECQDHITEQANSAKIPLTLTIRNLDSDTSQWLLKKEGYVMAFSLCEDKILDNKKYLLKHIG